jgi:hypothetical protein
VNWQKPGGDFTREGEAFLHIPRKEELNARIEDWFEWDVTGIVASWTQGETPNHGFVVWQPDVCNQSYDQAINFASLDYDDPEVWPQLVVEWEE